MTAPPSGLVAAYGFNEGTGTTVADASGTGNNGTVKMDGNPIDDGPNNEPHLGCTFDIDWYGFDAGSWSVLGSTADAVSKLQTAAQAAGVAAAAFLFARSRRTPADLAAAAATTIAVAAVAGKVLSPQFLLWLAPFVVLVRSLLAPPLLAAAMLLTNLIFPDRYTELIARRGGEIALLAARNMLLLVLLAALFVAQARAPATVERRG